MGEEDDLRVIMAGATGKTGSAVCRYLLDSNRVEVVGAVGPSRQGEDLGTVLGTSPAGIRLADSLAPLLDSVNAAAVVDFTTAEAAEKHAFQAIETGVSPVIGTTGFSSETIEQLHYQAETAGIGGAIIPNFSLGIMLLQRWLRAASSFYSGVEILEAHHQTKRDQPSGTARQLKRLLEAELKTGGDVPVHSIRLPGLVAHHEVKFGGEGETLTIRHDTTDRSSFAPGVVLTLERLGQWQGMVTTLEQVLEYR